MRVCLSGHRLTVRLIVIMPRPHSNGWDTPSQICSVNCCMFNLANPYSKLPNGKGGDKSPPMFFPLQVVFRDTMCAHPYGHIEQTGYLYFQTSLVRELMTHWVLESAHTDILIICSSLVGGTGTHLVGSCARGVSSMSEWLPFCADLLSYSANVSYFGYQQGELSRLR